MQNEPERGMHRTFYTPSLQAYGRDSTVMRVSRPARTTPSVRGMKDAYERMRQQV